MEVLAVVDATLPASLDDARVPEDMGELHKAIVAASIDETAVNARALGYRPVDVLTREHVDELRQAGCTRDEARAYFDSLFSTQQIRLPDRSGRGRVVDILMSDLDSYGTWRGDNEPTELTDATKGV